MAVRRLRVAIAGLAVAVAIGLLPAAASADIRTGTYTVKTKDVSVGYLGFASGSAACGTGKRVVGGGAYWHSPDSTAMNVDLGGISSSFPMPNGRGWTASGLEGVGSGAAVFRIVALCLPTAAVGTYTVQSTDIELAAMTNAGASATCPTGQRAVTGGAYTHLQDQGPDTGTVVTLMADASIPAGKAWYAAGYAPPFGTKRLQVQAFCLPKASVGTLTIKTKDIDASYTDTNKSRVGGKVSCGAGRRVISGGGWWKRDSTQPQLTLPGTLLSSAPTATGTGWMAAGLMDSGQTATFHIVAVCVTI